MAKGIEWTPQDEVRLTQLYQSSKSIEEVSIEFPGRNINSIRLKASRMGLLRPIPFQEQGFALCSQCGRLVPEEEIIRNNGKNEYDIKNRLATELVTNSPYNKVIGNELILTYVAIVNDQPDNRKRELVSKLVTIFNNMSTTETLFALAAHRAATVRVLLIDIGTNDMSINRSLNVLQRLGLAHKTGKTKSSKSLRGPKPTVWAIHGYTPDDIIQAIVTHQRLASPLYSESERITHLILDDYISPKGLKEVTREEILPFIKKLNPGFSIGEFSDRILSNLQEQGIKVWR